MVISNNYDKVYDQVYDQLYDRMYDQVYDQVLEWCAQLLEILGGRYGTELTSKGFRRLASKLKVLHSSWICHDALEPILSRMKDCGWSADNVAFGNDGELLQYVTSDDQECHLECSHVIVGTSVVCILTRFSR